MFIKSKSGKELKTGEEEGFSSLDLTVLNYMQVSMQNMDFKYFLSLCKLNSKIVQY